MAGRRAGQRARVTPRRQKRMYHGRISTAAAPDTEAIGFPVDLSREEYIAFNMLLAKNGGMLRFRKGAAGHFSA